MSAHVKHSCDLESCIICRLELYSCDVCCGGEGALPTDCPGYEMSEGEICLVYDEKADFIGGRWVMLGAAVECKAALERAS